MRPLFHPILINGRFGDSGLFVGPMFEKRAVQFDLGDLAALPARRVLRIAHVFVSHAQAPSSEASVLGVGVKTLEF